MTFLDRYAAEWAARAGCRVFMPGEALPECPPPTIQEVTERLLRAGCTVLQPGEVPAVSLERAKQVCEAHYHKVFPPRDPPALGPWVPHKHEKGKPPHPTRIVTATPGTEVHYTAESERHQCQTGSFWSWRSKVDARHQEPGAP